MNILISYSKIFLNGKEKYEYCETFVIPVLNITLQSGLVSFSNLCIASATTAEYKWPKCGAKTNTNM